MRLRILRCVNLRWEWRPRSASFRQQAKSKNHCTDWNPCCRFPRDSLRRTQGWSASNITVRILPAVRSGDARPSGSRLSSRTIVPTGTPAAGSLVTAYDGPTVGARPIALFVSCLRCLPTFDQGRFCWLDEMLFLQKNKTRWLIVGFAKRRHSWIARNFYFAQGWRRGIEILHFLEEFVGLHRTGNMERLDTRRFKLNSRIREPPF